MSSSVNDGKNNRQNPFHWMWWDTLSLNKMNNGGGAKSFVIDSNILFLNISCCKNSENLSDWLWFVTDCVVTCTIYVLILFELYIRGRQWEWGPVGPNASLAGGFSFAAGGSGRSRNIVRVPGFEMNLRWKLNQNHQAYLWEIWDNTHGRSFVRLVMYLKSVCFSSLVTNAVFILPATCSDKAGDFRCH